MNASAQPGTLGKYTPIASLGKGGMANVYLALMSGPSGFNKLLVVKELRDDVEIARDELVGMFLDEARLAAQLHHRNIVQTYEFGEVGGRCYMAMEYLEGQTLRAVQKRTPLPLAEELRVLAEVARGLHYAHELRGFDGRPLSVVHRDVSPQNVMLTYDGQVKLLDFGIAKIDGAEHLTKVGAIKGKIDYIAPEQVRSEALDRRADVFSLGAMLWEALTHERFGGGHVLQEVQKIHRRISGSEPSIRERAPTAPEVLLDLVEQSIALDPAARLPSCARFADRLEGYLASLSERPSDNSLAAWMSGTFESDRLRLRERVDRQIKRVQERGVSPTRRSLSQPPSAFADPITGVLDLTAAGSVSRSNVEPTQLPRAPSAAPSAGVQSASRRKRSRYGVFAVIGAVVIAAIAAAVVPSDPPHKAAATAESAPSTTRASTGEQPAATPAAPSTVQFSLSVSPANARVTLDGAPLPRVPFSGEYVASSALHHIEASADGYRTEKQLVTFEEDRALQIVLTPELVEQERTSARGRGRRTETTATAQQATTEPAPSQPRSDPAPGQDFKPKPTRQHFDMNDPYAD